MNNKAQFLNYKQGIPHIFMVLMLLFSPSLMAQNFHKTYANGMGISVKKTASGYQIISQNIDGYEAILTDNNGSMLSTFDLGMLAQKIIPLNAGGFLKLTSFPDPDHNAGVQKIDQNGNTIWTKAYGTIDGETLDMIETSDGGFVLVSNKDNNFGYPLTSIRKYNNNGIYQQGIEILNNPDTSNPNAFSTKESKIIQKTDGDFVVVSDGYILQPGQGEPAIQKIEIPMDFSGSDRSIIYTKYSAISNFEFKDLIATSDNGFVAIIAAHEQQNSRLVYRGSIGDFSEDLVQECLTCGGDYTYYSAFPTSDGLIGSAYVYYQIGTAPVASLTTHTLRHIKNDGTSDWVSTSPDKSYDGLELASGNLAFTGEENGQTYLVVTGPDGQTGCSQPQNYTPLGSFNGHEYFLSNNQMTWEAAQAEAIVEGGNIVTISNEAENNFIKNTLNEVAFIGLSDDLNEGIVTWANGETVSYTNYATGCIFCGSNTDQNDYATMMPWNGSWGFDNQYVNRKYILEKQCENDGISIAQICLDDFGIKYGAHFLYVNITNHTDALYNGGYVSLHQEFETGLPPNISPIHLGSSPEIPVLEPGQSTKILILESTSFNVDLPNLNYLTGTPYYRQTLGDYYFELTENGSSEVVTKLYDFYCKKNTTNIQVAINEGEYGNDEEGDFVKFKVQYYNNGNDDAHNVRVQLMDLQSDNPVADYANFQIQLKRDSSIAFSFVENKEGESTVTIGYLEDFLAPNGLISYDVIYHFPGGIGPDEFTIHAKVSSGHIINEPTPENNMDTYTFVKNGSSCPTSIPDFSYMGQYNGHSYFLSNYNYRWPEAAEIYNTYPQGYLVTIDDIQENEFIRSHLNGIIPYIGFHDSNNEGFSEWIHGEPVTIDNSAGNSNENDYAVINFWDGSWSFQNFWVAKRFVMEMDCASPPTIPSKITLTKVSEVYPNPASDILFARFISDKDHNADINIFDATGQLLLTENRDIPKGGSELEFDISSFSEGLYFIKVGSEYLKFTKIK